MIEQGWHYDQGLIDRLVAECSDLIEAAVDTHPELNANAIRMTVLDVLAATICSATAQSNVRGATIDQIIDQHSVNVMRLCQAIEIIREEHNGQQS